MSRLGYDPRLRGIAILVGTLLAGNVVLSGALAFVALRSAPVVVVPGVREQQVVLPDEVPDAAVRKFAHLYLYYFDDYTPETVEERSSFVLRLVAPEIQEHVRRELLERATYAVRTREASHLVLPPPELSPVASAIERLSGGLFRFSIVGERHVYIASQPKGNSKVRYVLTLRSALPSDHDAYGLVVVSQTMRPEIEARPTDRRPEAAHD